MDKTMKILLVNPKSSNQDALPIPPLGILYLAAYARGKGYQDIEIIDNNRENISVDNLTDRIKAADIVGLTGTTSQFRQAKEIASLAKKNHKLVVAGGPHATSLAEEVLKTSDIDVVAVGEGEVTFYEILEAVRQGKGFFNINGIIFKNNNEIIKNKERPFIMNLDELPMPGRDLIPMTEYPQRELKRFSGKFTHMMSSRGCSGKCIFCSSPMMWKYPRLMSATRTLSEMKEIYNKYGIKNIHFQDDSFTINRVRVNELCDLILKSGIDFKWSCQARPDCVDFELLKKMAEAGCVQIEFGVESGDQGLLKSAVKGYSKQQIRKAFSDAKSVGLTTYGFFIIGLPGETIITWLKSIIFAKSLKLDNCVWTILVPFPGTKVFIDNMVEIIDKDYLNWRYKNPIIKVGYFTPRILFAMRKISDILTNGLFNTGTYKKKI
ncbi:MAG: radical SAM protein [Candidatus Falkowbacteria bacterium]